MIIGISGKARSGKDTFADFLVDVFYSQFNRKFKTMAFADELKYLCKIQFGLSYEQLWGDSKEKLDYRYRKQDGEFWTAREIMQAVGEFYRSIDADYWVKALDQSIKNSMDKDIIITDVRYPNEFNYVKESGGIIIRIYRVGGPYINNASHSSECALDSFADSLFDVVIHNDKTLDDLYSAAYEVAEFVETGRISNLITKTPSKI